MGNKYIPTENIERKNQFLIANKYKTFFCKTVKISKIGQAIPDKLRKICVPDLEKRCGIMSTYQHNSTKFYVTFS
jgi:hypothetical protein